MNHLVNIIRKELRELLTPGSVISVLIMMFLFAAMGGMIGGEMEKAGALPGIGVVNADGEVPLDPDNVWSPAGYLDRLYTSNGVPEDELDSYIKAFDRPEDGDYCALMVREGISSLLVFPEDFYSNIAHNMGTDDPLELKQVAVDEYYLFEPTGMFGTASSLTVSSIVASMNKDLSSLLTRSALGSGSCYEFVSDPIAHGGNHLSTIVNGEAHKDIAPQDISSQISSQTMMVPLIIMIIIMMVGSIVISSMGSEKENKTLETLLTLPIKRTTIVTGKIVAAAIVGLVYGMAYMIGMSVYMKSMTGPLGTGVDLASMGMELDPLDMCLLMASMFLAIICALGICMVLGAFAKNYKSAQTMTMPLSILVMLPMFVIMFSGWYGAGAGMKTLLFAIPFSHPMIAMESLMYDDLGLVLSGIAYMSVFAACVILATVRLYRSDILITGLGQSKAAGRLGWKKRYLRCPYGTGMYDEIARKLSAGRKAVLVHGNGDMDALGSAYALSTIFPGSEIFAPDGLDRVAKMVAEKLSIPVHETKAIQGFERYVVVDTSSPDQLGLSEPLPEGTVVIDHHMPTGKWDGYDYYCDPESTSCCEMMVEIADAAQRSLSRDAALLLLGGMLTDSGHFQFAKPRMLLTFGNLMTEFDIPMDEAMAVVESEVSMSEKVAMMKSLERTKFDRVGRYIVATSYTGSFEASCCRAIMNAGADVVFVGSQRDCQFRVSGRATQDAVRKGIRLGEIMSTVGEETLCDGGGHDGAAGISGIGDAEAMLHMCMSNTMDRFREMKARDQMEPARNRAGLRADRNGSHRRRGRHRRWEPEINGASRCL